MEYVAGQEIDRYCDSKTLDLKSRLRLILEVAAAVQYAHENLVVHRDLKPGNILVGKDGEPKLLDFGIAKVLDPMSGPGCFTASTRVLTPEYASPEQVRGDAITTASDIYSLGAVLYRLLTGRPPHAVENLGPLDAALKISQQEASIPSDVPADVGAILQKALHTDPGRRYRSADEFSNDIQRYLDGKPVLAVPDSVGYKAAKFLRRHWIPVLATAAGGCWRIERPTRRVWRSGRRGARSGDSRRCGSSQISFCSSLKVRSTTCRVRPRRVNW